MWSTQNGTTVYDIVVELKRVARLSEFNSPRKAKLRGGYLLGDFVRNLQQKAAGELDKKLVLYSAVSDSLAELERESEVWTFF